MAYRPYVRIDVPNRRGVVRIVQGTKPPRQKHKPGDVFRAENGDLWQLVYIYRITREIGVWHYCIENVTVNSDDARDFRSDLEHVCCPEDVPRMVYEEFMTHEEAAYYFSSIPILGECEIRQTQQLNKLKKLLHSELRC